MPLRRLSLLYMEPFRFSLPAFFLSPLLNIISSATPPSLLLLSRRLRRLRLQLVVLFC